MAINSQGEVSINARANIRRESFTFGSNPFA